MQFGFNTSLYEQTIICKANFTYQRKQIIILKIVTSVYMEINLSSMKIRKAENCFLTKYCRRQDFLN